MDYNQFWNDREWKQPEQEKPEEVNWSQEFDYDDSENIQEPEKYDALISPDAYSYLDDVNDSEFKDNILSDSQDDIDNSDDYDTSDIQESGKDSDDSDMYKSDSLFDEDEEETEEATEEDKACIPTNENEMKTQEPEVEIPEITPVFENIGMSGNTETETETETVPETPEKTEDIVLENKGAESNFEVGAMYNFRSNLLNGIFAFIPPYCSFGTYLKTLSDSDISDIEKVITDTKNAWLSDGKDKMFNIPDGKVTIAVIGETQDPMISMFRLQRVAANMLSYDCDKWSYVKLFFEADGSLKKAEVEEVSQGLFSAGEWKAIRDMGFRLYMSR